MKLTSIHLTGYKSIDNRIGTSIEFGDITIMLGANGVGKSNLVSFFEMLNYIMTGALQKYVAERGFADTFLFFGAKQTREIMATLNFSDDSAEDIYEFRLNYAAGDQLIFTEETISYKSKTLDTDRPFIVTLNPGVRESDLLQIKWSNQSKTVKTTANVILNLLKNCKVFHFHDTSLQARIRNKCYIEDNRYLNNDAGNLAAFLYRLKEANETHVYYQKILRYIQKAMPQFGDFDLSPDELNRNYISLNWHDKTNYTYLLGPHQISDGSLRFMCLATLLLQPPKMLPKVIILDEPELGLHPSAITYLSGMIKAASKHAQIIVATQSPSLVDEFELENIVVVERQLSTNATTFSRKNADDLAQWLEDYSLSELWEKNVIGGQP